MGVSFQSTKLTRFAERSYIKWDTDGNYCFNLLSEHGSLKEKTLPIFTLPLFRFNLLSEHGSLKVDKSNYIPVGKQRFNLLSEHGSLKDSYL